jgi:glycosyltransferase involved in cell wall biosynthesis
VTRPRVVHVLEALESGTARHVMDVVRYATGTDHEVVVPPRRIDGGTDEAAIDRMRDAGAEVHLLPMRRKPYAPRNVVALLRLRALLRRRRPDVVHGHSGIGGVMARLAAVGSGRPRVYTPNGITDVRAGLFIERSLRPLTECFVAVSASEGEHAVELGLVDRDRLEVIPNGVAPEEAARVPLRTRLGISDEIPLVGTIARLAPQKAPEVFIAACVAVAREVPDAHFVMMGDGPSRAEVELVAASSGLGPRLHVLGTVPGAAGAVGDLDVFLLTSRFEGGPYAPLEAMRAGVPVVLTDAVGSRDVLVDGESGRLVPVDRPDASASAVVELLRDHALRARLTAGGRERVASSFDVRQMGAHLDALYARLARGG